MRMLSFTMRSCTISPMGYHFLLHICGGQDAHRNGGRATSPIATDHRLGVLEAYSLHGSISNTSWTTQTILTDERPSWWSEVLKTSGLHNARDYSHDAPEADGEGQHNVEDY
jgi:hypothetical protein